MGTWLNVIGAGLRALSAYDVKMMEPYSVALIGQILCACAQPFAMFAPTKAAASWFKENQRTTANMIASMGKKLVEAKL